MEKRISGLEKSSSFPANESLTSAFTSAGDLSGQPDSQRNKAVPGKLIVSAESSDGLRAYPYGQTPDGAGGGVCADINAASGENERVREKSEAEIDVPNDNLPVDNRGKEESQKVPFHFVGSELLNEQVQPFLPEVQTAYADIFSELGLGAKPEDVPLSIVSSLDEGVIAGLDCDIAYDSKRNPVRAVINGVKISGGYINTLLGVEPLEYVRAILHAGIAHEVYHIGQIMEKKEGQVDFSYGSQVITDDGEMAARIYQYIRLDTMIENGQVDSEQGKRLMEKIAEEITQFFP